MFLAFRIAWLTFYVVVKGQEQISVTIPNVTSTIVGTVGGFVFGILLMLAVIWILKQRSNLFNNRTVHRKMSGDSGHGNNPSKTLKPETSYSSLCIADEPSYSYQILSEAQMEKDDGNQEYEPMKHANSSQNTGTEEIQAYETMKPTNSSKNTEETKEDETMKHTNSSKNTDTEETQEYETMKRTNSSNNTETETKSKDLACA
ncbi:uncharacterized protein LOC128218678 isoform X2 [Mya arenaria]|uniref:uncharacterized protein LOC128218678 isoform X2 n=1 Tax=Mya arenaria TaxID=6604 RepID=UPI0022E97ED4|nr:uncharacterized protein LOC128218678 isoform X2 [Mya arenaria]